MHRKPHLEERLASCGDIVTVADLADKNMNCAREKKEYLDFTKIFGEKRAIHLEIGCGKGKFVLETARLNPDVGFFACEKISNVLIEALERAKAEGAQNVYFLNCAAEVLEKYFPDGSIDRIYLNFSNPLPKLGYRKQRLTHPRFLRIYRALLKDGGDIVQKTDDEPFFDFSLESLRDGGFEIVEECRGWTGGDAETEHEAKFRAQGKTIFRLVARKA